MADKTVRNELLGAFSDVSKLIERLEYEYEKGQKEATDIAGQLLKAYEIKVDIVKTLNNL